MSTCLSEAAKVEARKAYDADLDATRLISGQGDLHENRGTFLSLVDAPEPA